MDPAWLVELAPDHFQYEAALPAAREKGALLGPGGARAQAPKRPARRNLMVDN